MSKISSDVLREGIQGGLCAPAPAHALQLLHAVLTALFVTRCDRYPGGG
jgi:hypothetical protein